MFSFLIKVKSHLKKVKIDLKIGVIYVYFLFSIKIKHNCHKKSQKSMSV